MPGKQPLDSETIKIFLVLTLLTLTLLLGLRWTLFEPIEEPFGRLPTALEARKP